MEQRSNEWFEIRRGKITSSEIHKIICEPKEHKTDKNKYGRSGIIIPDIEDSEGAISYILKKVDELRSGHTDMEIDTYAMQWGTYYENVCKSYMTNELGLNFSELGFTPYEKYPLLVGGSCDYITKKAVGEIKCPEQLGVHARYSYYIKDALSLKDQKKEYYWQSVANALFNKKDFIQFVSFDDRQKGKKKFHLVEFEIIQEDVEILKTSIDKACEFYIKVLNHLK